MNKETPWYKSATRIFLVGLGGIVCIAFLIITIENSKIDAVVTTIMTMVNFMVGAVVGYFFRHNELGKEQSLPTTEKNG